MTKAAIVTCGGLCPGINNVIRTCVFELMHNYGVPEVLKSGDHKKIREYRRAEALRKTGEVRPDLLEKLRARGGKVSF